MNWTRTSGILLHPTSLPGGHGIGDLGQAAYRWIDFLVKSHQRLWQVLPLGPTGFADSPYACFSAFAGNPLLISLETLAQAGYLLSLDSVDMPAFPQHEVDYGTVIAYKTPLLHRAAERFLGDAPPEQRAAYHTFCVEHAHWLDDYALFMALKERFHGAIWYDWDADIALRRPEALGRWADQVAGRTAVHKVLQFWFFEQWLAVKAYANEHGIQIIGDVPIFVAGDSADVWAHPDLFCLDERGRPTLVSGVPPDYFSETGQRWGNPLYRWDVMAEQGYAWWIARTRAALRLLDIVRIDHFRGFVGYWEIPASEPTAVRGRWMPGPGAAFFEALESALGKLPIMAEDLGVITPEVIALRERFDLPGMKILQFAFDEDALRASFGERASSGERASPGERASSGERASPGERATQEDEAETWRNPFLPHNYTRDFVAYTGTHDNDTALGWLQHSTPAQRQKALDYLYSTCADVELPAKAPHQAGATYPAAAERPIEFNWALICAAMASVADLAVVPLQDVLGLGSDSRMNLPGTVGTNWRWRSTPGAYTDQIANRLAKLVERYER